MTRGSLLLACLGALTLALAPGPSRAKDACAIAPELVDLGRSLPHLHDRIAAHQPVRIVAIGASSTAGAAAGGTEFAFPQRLAAHLQAANPALDVTVSNHGIQRQSAQQMVDRFAADVLAEHPTLVIWEVGANDAVRSLDLEEYARTLQAGIDRLKQAGADLVLIDMQYSRSAGTVINLEPYLATLRRTADVNDVPVFRRYDIMRAWSEEGTFDLDENRPAQRMTLARDIYDCIGSALARGIGQAAR